MTGKPQKPNFQSVEIDLIDQRLESQAAEKGIPTLVAPRPEVAIQVAPAREPPPRRERAARGAARVTGRPSEATPRSRMKTVNLEVPDYAWVAIKMRAAQEMTSARHVIMMALRASGIDINEADMVEDGRRHRGTGYN